MTPESRSILSTVAYIPIAQAGGFKPLLPLGQLVCIVEVHSHLLLV